MVRALRFPALVAALLLLVGQAWAADRVALVIGNSAYQNVGPLPNPANDAPAVADAFRRVGFDVELEHDLTFDQMRRVLLAFADKAAGAEMAVVFYAGHGMEIDKQNYLIPVDAKLATDRSVAFEAVPIDLVTSAVEGAKVLKMVLLDACRNNPFSAQMKVTGGGRSIGRGLSRIEPSTGTLVGFSAREGTIADDGNGSDSPYTIALLKHLEEPGLEVNLMFRKVRDDVLAATGNHQEPFVYGSLPGENIYLVPPAEGPAAAPAVAERQIHVEDKPTPPAVIPEDRLAWDAVKDTVSVAMLKSFVARYPQSLYADFATARIAELDVPVKPPPAPARQAPDVVATLRDFAANRYMSGSVFDVELLSSIYADQVDYYAKGLISRSEIIDDKRAYGLKWPSLDYVFQPDTFRADPLADGHRYLLTFQYAFRAENGKRRAAGTAEARLTVDLSGDTPRIVQEDGSVLTRR